MEQPNIPPRETSDESPREKFIENKSRELMEKEGVSEDEARERAENIWEADPSKTVLKRFKMDRETGEVRREDVEDTEASEDNA